MKKLLVAVVIGIMLVGLFGTSVLADGPEDTNPVVVDIVIVGTDSTVTVEANGDDATLYINGQNLAEPTVIRRTKIYEYYIDNPYNDNALKGNIHSLEALLGETGTILAVTNDGLAKIILVIGEHTGNLRELLGLATLNAEGSINRDNELESSIATHKLTTSESISDLEENYQRALATALVNMDARVDELSSDFNAKLVWTWSGVGVFGLLLLGIWRIWQVRLKRD